MKRCSASLGKCKWKLQWDAKAFLVESLELQTDHSKCGLSAEEPELLYAADGKVKLLQTLWTTVWELLKIVGHTPASPLLDIFQEKWKHMTIQDLYMNVHNSFTCSNWKLETTQIHNKRLIERQIMYTYTREYYSAIKRNEYSTWWCWFSR